MVITGILILIVVLGIQCLGIFLAHKRPDTEESYKGQPDLTESISKEFNIELDKASCKYYPKRNDYYFIECVTSISGYALTRNLNYEKKEISKSSYVEAVKFIDEYIKKNYSGTEILPYTKEEIRPEDIWNNESRNNVKDFILNHAKNQSKEQILRNQLLGIKYQIEDYLEKK